MAPDKMGRGVSTWLQIRGGRGVSTWLQIRGGIHIVFLFLMECIKAFLIGTTT